jgi:MFS family permease
VLKKKFLSDRFLKDLFYLQGGQVVYAFGYSGIYILGPTLIGGTYYNSNCKSYFFVTKPHHIIDMTSLSSRTLILAIYNFPLIVNQFTAGAAAQSLLNHNHWRWGYGHICIVIFATGAPIVVGLWNIQRKAKNCILSSNNSTISSSSSITKQSTNSIDDTHKNRFKLIVKNILWFIHEIDLVGSILLVAGLFLILLPITLAPSWGGWNSSKFSFALDLSIICH